MQIGVGFAYTVNIRLWKGKNMEYVLLAVLLVAAVFIVIAVLFQKSSDEGLSGTIAGGSETYYGKDKSKHTEKLWFKWTLIASLVFALAVILTYVVQPDYSYGLDVDYWQKMTEFSGLFD
jgi:preprotein translocase subunit SecG